MKTYYYNKTVLILITALTLFLLAALAVNAAFQDHLGFIEMLASFLCLLVLTVSVRFLAAAYKQIPALTIDKEGIYDYSSGLTFRWKDIQSYKFDKTPMSCISVSLNNPDEYIKLIKNPIRRLGKKVFNKHTFSVNTSLLTQQDERILDHIEYYDLEFQRAFMESL